MARKFKIGDKVKITKKTDSNTHGWHDSWISPDMDDLIGKNGTVIDYSPVTGYRVRVEPSTKFNYTWWYPARSLALHQSKKARK